MLESQEFFSDVVAFFSRSPLNVFFSQFSPMFVSEFLRESSVLFPHILKGFLPESPVIFFSKMAFFYSLSRDISLTLRISLKVSPEISLGVSTGASIGRFLSVVLLGCLSEFCRIYPGLPKIFSKFLPEFLFFGIFTGF